MYRENRSPVQILREKILVTLCGPLSKRTLLWSGVLKKVYNVLSCSPDIRYLRFDVLHRVLGLCIGLYRDVWIAAIASSRTSLATLTGVICNTSQCELRSLRVNSGMLNVIRIVTYLLHITLFRVARLVLDGNGVFAIKPYEALLQQHCSTFSRHKTAVYAGTFGCDVT